MMRRLVSALMAALVSISTLAGGATPAAANHLECATDDPHDELPPNGGRITVVYESQLLASPAFPNAALIAAQIQDRAEAPLARYDDLDFPVPPAVTISIKCRLSAVGVFPIDPDVPGYTDDSDSVQLRTDYLQAQFAMVSGSVERSATTMRAASRATPIDLWTSRTTPWVAQLGIQSASALG